MKSNPTTYWGAIAIASVAALWAMPAQSSGQVRAGRDWWSLQPVRPIVVPDSSERPKNAIDHFILARLKKENLTTSPMADRRPLIRRLTFDLIGLPPTPREVEAFAKDTSPDAYERLVDRLLDSPH